jgi:type IV pilus assembly protein PilM
LVPDPEPGPEESAPEEQVWTRAVSFGRKHAEDSEEQPEPAESAGSGPVLVPDPEPGPEESAPEEQVWTRAVSFGRKQAEDSEPQPEQVEAVADTPAPADAGSDPQPSPEVTAPEEASVASGPVLVPDPEPVVSALPPQPPPVAPVPVALPADEAPTQTFTAPEPEPAPEAEAQKKVPFWKKELSFGGGKKRGKKPKAEKAPKEPKAAKEKKQPKERKQKPPKVKAARGPRGGKKLVGLKVGASQVAAARVSNNGVAELLQVAREPLETGIVVGGELRDPDALGEALKEFFAKNKLPKKGVRLGIANNRIGVRTFDIAGISDQKQLTNAIRFRAQEALPIPIDEAVLDYQVLGEGVDEEGQPTKRILLVVAYRELIDRYMDACKKAGISLVGIDLEAFALLRALQAPQDGAGGDAGAALVAVSIGHDRSTFAVSDGRVCEFTRVLEWGGAALNVAIARALDAAPSEVEDAKRALALTDEMVPDGLSPERAKSARDAMRRSIQTFARELVSSLQYYQNQPGSLGIGEIVLTGGTAHLPGLAGELERLIGVRVRVGDPLARMKVSKKLGETEQIGSLAVAIGLGIED